VVISSALDWLLDRCYKVVGVKPEGRIMNTITLEVQDSLGNVLSTQDFTPLVDDKIVTNSYYGSTYVPVGPMSDKVIVRLPVSEEDEGKTPPAEEPVVEEASSDPVVEENTPSKSSKSGSLKV
jgi:hypothetical protein